MIAASNIHWLIPIVAAIIVPVGLFLVAIGIIILQVILD